MYGLLSVAEDGNGFEAAPKGHIVRLNAAPMSQ
jgi:hypothetical protein